MKPGTFDGTKSLETFMCKFSNCAKYNRWDEKDKSAFLRGALEGEAAQLLWDSNRLSYSELVEKLKKRFGSKGMEERYQTELRCRRRKKDEGIRELAQDIRRLMTLAYPRDEPEESVVTKHLARDAFLRSLNDPDLELKIREREPGDLNAAETLAQRFEISRGVVEATATQGRYRDRAMRQMFESDRISTAEPREVEARIAAVERRLSQTAEETQHHRRDNGQHKSHTRERRRNRAVEHSNNSEMEQVLQEIRQLKSSQRKQSAKLEAKTEAVNKELVKLKYLHQMRSGNLPQSEQRMMHRPSQGQRGNQGGGDRPKTSDLCWNCNEAGHYSRFCPQARMRQRDRQRPNDSKDLVVAGTSRNHRTATERASYLHANVGRQEHDCLLDSGSEVSLLPAPTVPHTSLLPTKKTLKAANGTEIPVLGKATVPLETEKFSSSITGLVSEHVAEVMLGIDWLTENNASWDFKGASILLAGSPHALTVCRGARKWCRRVILMEDVQVPPRSQTDLPCKVVFQRRPIEDDRVQWTTQPISINGGMHVARTLMPADRFSGVPVRVMNARSDPQLIYAGTVISDLEPLSVAQVTAVGSYTNPAISQEETAMEERTPRNLSGPGVPSYVKDLVDKVDDATPENVVVGLQELLLKNRHVFSESECDLRHTNIIEHRIDTGSAKPVRQQLRRYPPAHLEVILEHIDNMLQQGIIEKASSPWASNIVLVKKKDDNFRCCIDYRQLNNVTVKDAYPLPRIDSCLDAMSEARWFSTFDLRSSYHQVGVAPEDRDKTTFICPRGMYRYKTVPFGLRNAGATFQRLMDILMSGLHLEICLVYLDDIVVYAKTAEEHLERLKMIFQRLGEAGLKLKPEKCRFFRRSVSFLGHVISDQGIGTDPAKIEQVANWPTPASVQELRTFMGLSSYYRRFVRDFAKLASPLHSLMKKDATFRWSDEAQRSFETLKAALTSLPVLAMPPDHREYMLDTDASDYAIGAVLSQRQESVERVIAYASRSLDRRERNYCVTRKELLAVVYFLKYFKQYLLGRRFKVRTDHAALTWLRRTPDPIGQQARWLEQMEEYDFEVEHRPGVRHANADALSRRPCTKKGCACRDPNDPLFRGPADRSATESQLIAGTRINEDASERTNAADASSTRNESPVDVTQEGLWSLNGIRAAQQTDPDIGYIYALIDNGSEKPMWNDVSPKSKEIKMLWSFWPRLAIRDGLLKRRFDSLYGQDVVWQIVWPKQMRIELLKLIHAGATCGHLGYDKTAAAVQARVYWPSWSSDLMTFLNRCHECAQYHRGALKRQSELQTPLAGEPWERVSIDITGPHPKSARQNQFILTVVDHFSKWAEAIPLRNHTALTVAKALIDLLCMSSRDLARQYSCYLIAELSLNQSSSLNLQDGWR